MLACTSIWSSSSLQASAVPIPPQLARQAPNTFNNTYFPYNVTGLAPPSLYKPGQVLNRCTKPKSYAISFDDGPGQLTDELLDYLDEQKLQVTFFMNGDNWNCIYRPHAQRLLKRAYEARHQIAAHPWSHRDLESLSDKDIREEMNRIDQAFRQILGVVPRYMRPPYGEVGERVRLVLEEMGYVIILWDVDLLSVVDVEFSSSEIPFNANGATRHSHDGEQDTLASTSKWAEAVRGVPSTTLDRDAMTLGGIYQEVTPEWAIEYVQSLGYDIMPVAKCLGEDDPRLWYKEIGPPALPESLPLSCHQ
ncbi:Carbohydrate esterase 4 protein [Mortierella sp. AM989]|nr:Carbohydrate esterase 4 protein [Mortierella sp. AM989]